MAVTKQTYTATGTWTASQLASTFRSAFIDAGLMTEWFDSFLSGTIENRILQVVNNPTKTYGTVYYWFMFTTGGVFLHSALSWNAATDVPSGTQYLDYFSTTTNATTNHNTLVTLAPATNCTVTRYTSAVNTDCTWFVIRNGTTNTTFLVPKGNYNATSFIDQNIMAYNGIIVANNSSTSSFCSALSFDHVSGHTRRTYLGSAFLRAVTTSSNYNNLFSLTRYATTGNVLNGTTSNVATATHNYSVILPTAFTNTNTSLAADSTPVFTSVTPTPYLPALPSDFGIASYYASATMAVQDTLVVTAGTEEWEMIKVTIPTQTTQPGIGSTLLLARTI